MCVMACSALWAQTPALTASCAVADRRCLRRCARRPRKHHCARPPLAARPDTRPWLHLWRCSVASGNRLTYPQGQRTKHVHSRAQVPTSACFAFVVFGLCGLWCRCSRSRSESSQGAGRGFSAVGGAPRVGLPCEWGLWFARFWSIWLPLNTPIFCLAGPFLNIHSGALHFYAALPAH
jgi:hypothetical protein